MRDRRSSRQLHDERLDECQGVLALDIADIPNPQHLVQLVRGHLQRPWGGRRARRGLGVRRGHRRVKGDPAFDLLQNLMDVAVQHGDRAEAFHQGQRLLPILGDPPPGGVHGPEGDMDKHHEGGAVGESCHILFEPVQLVLAEAPQARRLEVQDVDEPDKMHALVIEALPAVPRGPCAVAVQKFLPPIGKDVMLAGHVKDLAALDLFKGLSEGVEGARFLAMGEVPGVEEKGRRGLERVDLGER